MSTSRYIEINSTYRNRIKYPCPAEFVIPVSCVNDKDPLEMDDPIVDSYPLFSWYQVPYATSIKEFEGIKCSDPCIRKINKQYYTSLWPLNINLADKTDTIDKQMHGIINAMKFGGGTSFSPQLNPNLVFPPNKWSVPDPNVPNNKNSLLNPYYLPIKNYLCGALLLRFKKNPTSELNNAPNYSFDDFMESSVIESYNQTTGIVNLVTPFSDDFDSFNDWFLIDFNTDPGNIWADYVTGGPRIFIPGGVTRTDAYKGLYIKNFTASMECSKKNIYSKILSYDNIRKIAYLDRPLDIVQRNENFIYDTADPDSCDETPPFLFGSNTFTIVKNLPSISRSYMEYKIGINNGSILKLYVHSKGKGYKVGEIIGSTNLDNKCAYEPFYDEYGNKITVIPDYIMNTSGSAFIGKISSVDDIGGIIEIDTIQQGYNYKIQNFNLEKYDYSKCDSIQKDTDNCIYTGSKCAQGQYAILNIRCTYQSIEVSKRNECDKKIDGKISDFLYLPLLGQNSTNKKRAPLIPRYSYTPVIQSGGTKPPYTSCYKLLDIKKSEYPPTIFCTDEEQKEIGVRQIQDIIDKDFTFNLFWKDGGNLGPITTFFLKNPFDLTDLGKNDIGESIFVTNIDKCFSNTGYLTNQVIEILPYLGDNEFPLNYTGSTVSQNQLVCYQIKLISLILPNIPLKNTIGGIIAFYPYIYVEFSNKIDPNGGNKGIIYSNNPNATRALFKVSIQDTNNPNRTSFIKLKGDSVQTIKFKPNDYLYFRVFLDNGILFETSRPDNSPPLPPDFFVQISAEFEIKRLV